MMNTWVGMYIVFFTRVKIFSTSGRATCGGVYITFTRKNSPTVIMNLVRFSAWQSRPFVIVQYNVSKVTLLRPLRSQRYLNAVVVATVNLTERVRASLVVLECCEYSGRGNNITLLLGSPGEAADWMIPRGKHDILNAYPAHSPTT